MRPSESFYVNQRAMADQQKASIREQVFSRTRAFRELMNAIPDQMSDPIDLYNATLNLSDDAKRLFVVAAANALSEAIIERDLGNEL